MNDNDLLNHHLISGRYFFPLLGEIEEPFWVDCGDAQLACSYHEVDPAAKTLIHFHGNGEIVDDWVDNFAAMINTAGWNCLLAEYRCYGRSTGRAQLGRILEDVGPIVRSLKRQEQSLVFFGRSIGSIFALEAARLFPQAAGVILESAIADVLERLLLRTRPDELGVSREEFESVVGRHLNQRRKLEAFQGALLVLHTLNDGLIDVSHAQRLYDWGKAKKELKIFERGNHNTISAANAEQYYFLVRRFLEGLS